MKLCSNFSFSLRFLNLLTCTPQPLSGRGSSENPKASTSEGGSPFRAQSRGMTHRRGWMSQHKALPVWQCHLLLDNRGRMLISDTSGWTLLCEVRQTHIAGHQLCCRSQSWESREVGTAEIPTVATFAKLGCLTPRRKVSPYTRVWTHWFKGESPFSAVSLLIPTSSSAHQDIHYTVPAVRTKAVWPTYPLQKHSACDHCRRVWWSIQQCSTAQCPSTTKTHGTGAGWWIRI